MKDITLFKVLPAQFEARGKFLLTAEYAVLDNVQALAVPLKLKQYLNITPRDDKQLHWTSYNHDGQVWFDLSIAIDQVNGLNSTIIDPVAGKLLEVLSAALQMNNYQGFENGFTAVTRLDFDRKSGMGTSSTLISMIAQWLDCDPYALQFKCFGGSGYDIACATARQPILYTYNNGVPKVESITYDPFIKEAIYFVYLNKKQDSRQSIAAFDKSKLTASKRDLLEAMPQRFIETSSDLEAFEGLLEMHENLISSLVGITPVKTRLFPDYSGAIKSLGGWGGDFIMVTARPAVVNYFEQKGYRQIYRWSQLID